MSDYYQLAIKTIANSAGYEQLGHHSQHFPLEGLYIGNLKGPQNTIPALIDLSEISSFCFLYNSSETKAMVNHCIERLTWRIAACVPSNLCKLLLFNGGQIGSAFGDFLSINDILFIHEAKVLQVNQISELEKCLQSISDTILSRVSTVHLANKKNLIELNESLGEDATIPYQFVCLTDFPNALNNKCIELLYNIIRFGKEAGVYCLFSWDIHSKLQKEIEDIGKRLANETSFLFPNSSRWLFKNSGHDELLNKFYAEIDGEAMSAEDEKKCASYINSIVESRQEHPTSEVLLQDFHTIRDTEYVSSPNDLSVSIGIDISTRKEITLRFNAGDFIHAFILGQSGSGKSVLLNSIITSAILKYSPEDLVLYLMDFKGVEFNRYKGEKHTRAVLVDNEDPQMTLEVLRELLDENKRRVKLWRDSGVNNIEDYNRVNKNRLPQILFIADECHVLFQPPRQGGVAMDIHREISSILNTIATQGRSQGIHMILATQQLDETDISGQILKNLTECILMMSAPSDSNRLVPDSSDLTEKQATGIACYYHKKKLVGQLQTFYANNSSLSQAISDAHIKAQGCKDNGGIYFNGSAVYSLQREDVFSRTSDRSTIALVGRNIGLKKAFTEIAFKDDYSENLLLFGANKNDQTANVALNAFVSLILSYRSSGKTCEFLVIDCSTKINCPYKTLLQSLEAEGYCRIVERRQSGSLVLAMARDILENKVTPTVLLIIGSERFIEMKRNDKLRTCKESLLVNEGIEVLSFEDPFMHEASNKVEDMTFQQGFTFILDEGPLQGIHTILQVDKPGNILFDGDYGINATDKFKHKIILRSENKYLSPMRLSCDIDVESLKDDEDHLRAYYYPEGDDPILFTPFILPDKTILTNLK